MTSGKSAVEEIREALEWAIHWSAEESVRMNARSALGRLAELPTPEAIAEAEARGRKAGYDAGYGAGFDECASDAVTHLLENDQGLMARDVRECLHVGAAKRWTARVAKGAEEGT